MRNPCLLLAGLIFSSVQLFSMNLKEAIDSKQVAVEVSGSDFNTMPSALRTGYAPGMQMTVSNLSDADLELTLEPGYLLEAVEPGYQAMLLVQSVGLKLKPNEKQLQFLYAMCTEFTKSGPGNTMAYQVAEKAKPALLQMAEFIAAKKYQNHAAQYAVWCISDDMPVTSISDDNPVIQNDLQKQAASIKGINIDALREEYARRKEDYKKRKEAELTLFDGDKLDRNMVFSVKDTAMVSVGFYDHHGNLIKPIFNTSLFREGKHCIRYSPYPVALAGKQYSVRMIKDGAVFKEYYFMQ